MAFSDYDCIGFDLDNTLAEYSVPALTQLIYQGLSDFLITEKGYSAKFLQQPLYLDFLQKGLALDLERGNIVKLGLGGKVLRACHGTSILPLEKISEVYGKEGIWDEAAAYVSDPFQAWNGPLGSKIRCVLDNFDIPAALVFARAIDSKKKPNAEVWPDILAALNAIYQKDHFKDATSNFFSSVTNAPDKFLRKCPELVIKALRKMKQNGKVLYLITGSALDFANFTATYSIGPFWKELFDIIVCFARKPGFFSEERPFIAMNGEEEADACTLDENTHIVSQGNWKVLQKCLEVRSGKETTRFVYIGDNVVQDVLAPTRFSSSEAFGILGDFCSDEGGQIWGSYFQDKGESTFWNSVLTEASGKYALDVDLLLK